MHSAIRSVQPLAAWLAPQTNAMSHPQIATTNYNQRIRNSIAEDAKMVELKLSQDNVAKNFADDAIAAVAGPHPHDTVILSYVFISGRQPIGTLEPVQSLIDRLKITNHNFAMLTRPNGTPVWIRAIAMTEIRDPVASELPDPPNITRSIVRYAGFHQAIQESIQTAKSIILVAGPTPGLFA
jgi:hypothetical protein